MALNTTWRGASRQSHTFETQSLKQRLNTEISSHDGYAWTSGLSMSQIDVLGVSGDTERLRIEADLRHRLKPSANAQNALGGFR